MAEQYRVLEVRQKNQVVESYKVLDIKPIDFDVKNLVIAYNGNQVRYRRRVGSYENIAYADVDYANCFPRPLDSVSAVQYVRLDSKLNIQPRNASNLEKALSRIRERIELRDMYHDGVTYSDWGEGYWALYDEY